MRPIQDQSQFIDHIEINLSERDLMDLLARFDDAAIRTDFDAFRALWTEDATWEIGDPLPMKAKGQQAIVAALEKLQDANKFFFRMTGRPVMTIDGDTASLRSPTVELAARGNGKVYANVAFYEDRAVRGDDGEWRFQSRDTNTSGWIRTRRCREGLSPFATRTSWQNGQRRTAMSSTAVRVLVVVDSWGGHMAAVAARVVDGIEAAGGTAVLRSADEATRADLQRADALLMGSAVHQRGMTWKMKRFVDEVCEPAWFYDDVVGRAAGVFTAGGGHGQAGGGAESAQADMLANLAACGMVLVSLPNCTPGFEHAGVHCQDNG